MPAAALSTAGCTRAPAGIRPEKARSHESAMSAGAVAVTKADGSIAGDIMVVRQPIIALACTENMDDTAGTRASTVLRATPAARIPGQLDIMAGANTTHGVTGELAIIDARTAITGPGHVAIPEQARE